MSSAAVSQPPVLIVGAGPSGLIAALSLSQNGIPVRIIDKSNEYQTGTRGPGLMPRSLELFALLGILPDILETAQLPILRRHYNEDNTQVLKTYPLMEILEPTFDVPYPNYMGNSQANTCETIRKHLAQYDVHVELGTALEGLDQDEDGVTVQLKKGATMESARFKYVYGSDGGKGVTRKLLEIPFEGERMEIKAIVADAKLKNVNREYWHVFGDFKAKMLRLLPIGKTGNTFYFVMTGRELNPDQIVADGIDGLRGAFHDLCKFEGAEVEELLWISTFRPSFRCAESFSKGRVFIGGDGAHVHSPLGGQGLNTSVQDAHDFSWKLALVMKGKAKPSLLDTYDKERLPVVKTMLGISQNLQVTPGNTKDFTPKTPDPSQPPATPAGPSQQRTKVGAGQAPDASLSNIMRMLAINYRWSSIVLDERGDAGEEAKLSAYGVEGGLGPNGANIEVRAGDRAPDAGLVIESSSGKATMTLFAPGIYKPTKHTVLIFVGAEAKGGGKEVVQSVSETLRPFVDDELFQVYIVLGSPTSSDYTSINLPILIDDKSQASKAYGISADKNVTIVVIRPDQVVGAYVFGVDGVNKYIGRIFFTDGSKHIHA